MKPDLTPKQEKFAQKYIELGNASEAYRQSYEPKTATDKTIWESASRLLADSKVAARIKVLQQLHQNRHEVTIDSITDELVEDRRFARRINQASAALSSTVHKAKLHGLLAERTEVTGKNGGPIETKDATDPADIARRVAFLLSQAAHSEPKPN